MTALSTVYGDGESVSAVALHYPKTIDASRLKASDFTVAGKTIDKVYTNDAPETALAGKKGSYVIVSLVSGYALADSDFPEQAQGRPGR